MEISKTRVYTPAQAAKILDLSTERVRQFANAGRLPCEMTPLGRLLDADAVDAMALARVGQPHPIGRRGMAQ